MRQRAFNVISKALPIAMCLLLVMTSAPAFAQEVYGSVQGRVVDANGAAISGATVELISEQRTLTTSTDGEGGYQFLNALPGLYKVQVTASGFGTRFRDNVPVELGRTISANFEMAATLAGEQVTVTA
jgi:hypothetical protein